ncbi:MAG: aldo/keto reductase [Bacteroidales bacterium]|nr:aldo/keto reductase [Bacteroidales bacterium]
MEQTYFKLNDGNMIPQFGLGVYQIKGDAATKAVCLEAIACGYRHIDTAHAYQNERGVGEAVRECGVDREDLWITSKLWPSEYGTGKTADAIDKMLGRLNLEYIDLLLLHQQFGDYLGAWRDMEKAVAQGKVRSIGISNFESQRLEELLSFAQIKPAVLQVECHPYYGQEELKRRIAPYGTALESWYPIGHGDTSLINEPVFCRLAEKYGKSNVQVILRWQIQKGHIVIPRSVNPQHIRENIEIFDFALTGEEMQEIAALDKGKRFFNMSLAEQERILGAWQPAI